MPSLVCPHCRQLTTEPDPSQINLWFRCQRCNGKYQYLGNGLSRPEPRQAPPPHHPPVPPPQPMQAPQQPVIIRNRGASIFDGWKLGFGCCIFIAGMIVAGIVLVAAVLFGGLGWLLDMAR